MFGERALMDKWNLHCAPDGDYKCVALKTGEDGFVIAEDIPSGIKMANISGYSAAEEADMALGHCAKRGIEHVHTGDKAILRNRGAEGGAVYWCRDCYCREYKEKHGEECSKSWFAKLSAHASGRCGMSLKQIADSASVKLTRDCFGGSSRDQIAKMRAYCPQGLDKKATGAYKKHVAKLAVYNPDAK